MSAREWLHAAAKVLFITLTTIGCYRYGLPLVAGQKGEPLQGKEEPFASPDEHKRPFGENGTPKGADFTPVVLAAKEERADASPEISINGEVTDGEASSSNEETNGDAPSKSKGGHSEESSELEVTHAKEANDASSDVDLSLKADVSDRGAEWRGS